MPNDTSSPQQPVQQMAHHLDAAFEELCHFQRERLLKLAREIEPGVTFEDILNPQTFPKILADPAFNYEDGYLAGLLAAQTSLKRKVIVPLMEGKEPEKPIVPPDSPFYSEPE
jgi:hypothetical protein